MQQVYKLYGSSANTAEGLASMDVRADGMIVGAYLSGYITSSTDASVAQFELSFLSSSGMTQNDTTGSICGLVMAVSIGAAGAMQGGHRVFIPMEVPVNSGERIFMHYIETGTIVTASLSAWLYIEEKAGASRTRVARR